MLSKPSDVCPYCNRPFTNRVITLTTICQHCDPLKTALDPALAHRIVSRFTDEVNGLFRQNRLLDTVLLKAANFSIAKYKEKTVLELKRAVLRDVNREIWSIMSHYNTRLLAVLMLNMFQEWETYSYGKIDDAASQQSPMTTFALASQVSVRRHAILYLVQRVVMEMNSQGQSVQEAISPDEATRLLALAELLISWWDDVECLEDSSYSGNVSITGDYEYESTAKDDETWMRLQICRRKYMGMWMKEPYRTGLPDAEDLGEILSRIDDIERADLIKLCGGNRMLENLAQIHMETEFNRTFGFGIGHLFKAMNYLTFHFMPNMIEAMTEIKARISIECCVNENEVERIIRFLCFDKAACREAQAAHLAGDLSYDPILRQPLVPIKLADSEFLALCPWLITQSMWEQYVVLVLKGGFPKKTKRLAKLFGRHRNQYSRAFENDVAEFLGSKECITRTNFNTLRGEIDVIAYHPGGPVLLLGECKNFEWGKRYKVMSTKELDVAKLIIKTTYFRDNLREMLTRALRLQVDSQPEVIPVIFFAHYNPSLCSIKELDAVLWADREGWWARKFSGRRKP